MTGPGGARFSDLEGRRASERKRCPGCGGLPLAGVVRIEARAYGSVDAAQPLKGGKTVASLSVSMCEPCVVGRYLAAEKELTA